MHLRSTFLLVTIITTAASPVSPQNTFPSSGNVGIGTSSPANLLQVHNVNIPANTVGSSSEIAAFSSQSSTGNKALFKFLLRRHTVGDNDWANVGARLQFITDVTGQGYLEFSPPGEAYGIALGTGATELIRFKLNGNVGIGLTNPAAKLQVAGARISIRQNGETRYHLYNGAGLAEWLFGQKSGTQSNFTLSKLSSGVETDFFSVDPSGNVGIGTAAPQSKLAVNGDIFSKKIKVTQSGWPDYVFDKNYRLRTIEETEQYIREHQHLPEMPSTTEVEKDGIDLGDNQAALLKKIEELTLYIIDQNKKIEEQLKRIDRLEQKLNNCSQ